MTRRDKCMVCRDICGDDGPTCGNCGESICIYCLTDEDKHVYFTNLIKYLICQAKKYPDIYKFSETNPKMVRFDDFKLFIENDIETFETVYNNFDDFDDDKEYNEDNLFICNWCDDEINANNEKESYIKYLEEKLTKNSIEFNKETIV